MELYTNADVLQKSVTYLPPISNLLPILSDNLCFISAELTQVTPSLMYHKFSPCDNFAQKKIIPNKILIKIRSSSNFIHIYLLFEYFLVELYRNCMPQSSVFQFPYTLKFIRTMGKVCRSLIGRRVLQSIYYSTHISPGI